MVDRLMRAIAFGAIGTAAHYALLIILVEYGKLDPVLASIDGFLIGALVNYFFNRYLVFRSQRAHVEAVPRFFTIALLGLLINAVLMDQLIYRAHWPYLGAQIFVTALLAFWHYGGNAIWTFRHHRQNTKSAPKKKTRRR